MKSNLKILPILFFILLLSSISTSFLSYHKAQKEIVNDLNKALAKTIKEKSDAWITPDTIRTYKQLRQAAKGPVMLAIADKHFCKNLNIKGIRKNAFITLDVVDQKVNDNEVNDGMLYSDTILIKNSILNEDIALRSYAQCSVLTIFSLSDQRLSLLLCITAMLWGIFSIIMLNRQKRENENIIMVGGLSLCNDNGRFYDTLNNEIHLTPMQEKLMQMFYSSPTHTLKKEDICSALWPKKDNADDTLYTLIKRLKPIIEEHSSLNIVSDRGKSYSLKIK